MASVEQQIFTAMERRKQEEQEVDHQKALQKQKDYVVIRNYLERLTVHLAENLEKYLQLPDKEQPKIFRKIQPDKIDFDVVDLIQTKFPFPDETIQWKTFFEYLCEQPKCTTVHFFPVDYPALSEWRVEITHYENGMTGGRITRAIEAPKEPKACCVIV